jgi:hypothetical protein
MAAAFLGRDSWAWSNVAVIAGAVALVIGAWLNRAYFSQAIGNRGKARRRPEQEQGPLPGAPQSGGVPDVLRQGRLTVEPGGDRPAAPERAASPERSAPADRPPAERSAPPDRATAADRPRYRIR